jgi:peptidoglycan hydrolase-like protein with peptidoglycan-binding domain
MTPGQARVALGGFFLLSIGVTSNALYLQGAVSGTDRPATSPARTEPARQPSTPKASKAAKAPDKTAEAPAALPQSQSQNASKVAQPVKVRVVRVATVAETRADPADADTVRAVQEELNRQGYGPVDADGVLRQPTRAAIMAFEQDHRLGLTGEASQDLLKTLVFGAPAATGAPRASEVRSPHAEAIVKQVQQGLAARGYRPGTIDGQVSTETVAAIRTFETDQGLVPKGRISPALLERLQTGIAAGGKHPAP